MHTCEAWITGGSRAAPPAMGSCPPHSLLSISLATTGTARVANGQNRTGEAHDVVAAALEQRRRRGMGRRGHLVIKLRASPTKVAMDCAVFSELRLNDTGWKSSKTAHNLLYSVFLVLLGARCTARGIESPFQLSAPRALDTRHFHRPCTPIAPRPAMYLYIYGKGPQGAAV
jgi:hypothetical protein